MVSNFGFGKNIIIFGVDSGSSTRVDNRKKDILVLGEAPTQGLDDTATISGSNILLTIPLPQKKNCLSLNCNGSNNFCMLRV